LKHPSGHSVPLLREPQPKSARPLYIRLYQRIRAGVLNGALPPGTRLPSARTLAREEGISRNTVEAALHQLQAEGFVVRKTGAGTWISDELPTRLLRPRRSSGEAGKAPRGGDPSPLSEKPPSLSTCGRRVTEVGGEEAEPVGLLFAPCVPGLAALPLDGWNRIATRHTRRANASTLFQPPPAGLPVLREAVAQYLHMDRGIECTAEQIIILNSTQQGINLVARLLLNEGDAVWFEDPGYRSARRALVAAGARPVPVPVDEEGIDVTHGASVAPEARLVYVTPSHQYPTGVTLSLSRRLELLAWAEASGGWILEDDYDSELRYEGRPLAAVQGIDRSERVLYAGTFNKILFPGLRVAYLVLPRPLVGPFARAKEVTDGFTPPLVQRVLAEFINEGHFSIHLRRVREVYRERRDRFLAVAGDVLPPHARLGPSEAGMHVALHFGGGVDDRDVSEKARRRGLAVPALSSYCIQSEARGLLVHYGHAPVADIERGTRQLAELL
jgi:GntR family transcriptional regulator / MocR family aminotransferase